MPAEIILIGGAAVLLNYGFRAANVLSNNHLDELYELYREEEQANREALVQFEKDYPEVTTEENVKDIIKHLKARRSVNSQVDQISQ